MEDPMNTIGETFTEQGNSIAAAATVPLLLNPTYARTKSLIHDELRNFRISLRWCALDHSSSSGKIISYIAFLLLALLVPAAISFSAAIHLPSDDDDSIINKLVQLPESALAAISFFTLTTFFHRYGLRQLLFLDGLRDDSAYVRRGYVRELDRAFKYLTYILLPSFSVEVAHKIIFFSKVEVPLPYVSATFPCNAIVLMGSLASWVYRTGVFLLVCVLFRLTCELQILRFEGFRKLLEGCGSVDAGFMFREHIRIKRQLLVTSHRYRIFIIGCLVTISISQLGALVLIFTSKSEKNFYNSGDLVVCSAVQLSGFFMCLLGAARITHRAQGVVSIASKWHMIMTCTNSHRPSSNINGSPPPVKKNRAEQVPINDPPLSNADPEPLDPADLFLDLESRRALVMYLQHNNGGITLFGFALDRGLLHTLFAFEMSLVLWILSKVVVLS